MCSAVPRVAPKWYDLGLALDVKSFVLDGVAHEQERADRPREMFAKWLQRSPGTGSQVRTWQSVLDAIGVICGTAAVEDIRMAVQTPRIPTAGQSGSSDMHDCEYMHLANIHTSLFRCKVTLWAETSLHDVVEAHATLANFSLEVF